VGRLKTFDRLFAQAAPLISWVDLHRERDLGRVAMDTAELVRFRFEDGVQGRLMGLEVLASARVGRAAAIG
jgi:hypothetical protein